MMCESQTSLRASITPYSIFSGTLVGLYMQAYITKKANHTVSLFSLISDFLSSQAVSSQVLSAFMSLTTVFEMGTGGSS